MKKASLLLILIFVSIVGMAATSPNKVEGEWKWSNPPVDYNIYIEFKRNGNMFIKRMKPSRQDIDKYKWNLDGNTIYYTRPGADDKVVNTMKIIKIDSSTLILRDKDGDLWLERKK